MTAPETALAELASLLDPRLASDPYPAYAQLRSTRPIWKAFEQLWVLSRHADCLSVLRDPRFGHLEPDEIRVEQRRWAGDNSRSGEAGGPVRSFLAMNPPDHTRLRGLVSRAFTPSRVSALAPHIEALVDQLLDGAPDGATVDLVALLASPLPVIVICELLGVPFDRRAELLAWSRAMARGLDPEFLLPAGVRAEQRQARLEFSACLRELIELRRARPTADLLSDLVQVQEGGDVLSEDELVSTGILLLIAGHETTTGLIGAGTLALVRNPDQLERLRSEPALVPGAVEELLRYDAPVQLTARIALEDAEIGDVPVPKGTLVMLLLGAANRDPAVYEDPERLDIERSSSRHLAFGHGIHFCLGAPLARLEAQIAFRHLSERFSKIELAGEPIWKDTAVLRGLRQLPVRLLA